MEQKVWITFSDSSTVASRDQLQKKYLFLMKCVPRSHTHKAGSVYTGAILQRFLSQTYERLAVRKNLGFFL